MENGKAAGQITAYTDYTVSFYDAEGKLLQTVGAKEDGTGYESKHLYAGDYTMIVLQGKIKNWIKETADAYESTGMTEGVDFVRRTVTVKVDVCTVPSAVVAVTVTVAVPGLAAEMT